MADRAHRLTGEKLEEMEKRLSAIYSRAEKEIGERWKLIYDCRCVDIAPTYSDGKLTLPAAASNYYYRSGTTYNLYYKL